MRCVHIFWFIVITASIAACNNEDKEMDLGIDTDALFFDYSITGDEGSEEVTCLLQYHYGGPEGETVRLPPPNKVELDNEIVVADSAQLSGAFYEVRKPLAEFRGKHTITFTNENNKKFIEPFEFIPFTLQNEIALTVRRDELVLQLNGLKSGDALRVLLIDTSFATDDINELMKIRSGGITLTKEQLQNVANGPVTLQLFKEEEREVKNAPGGGKLSITYGLSREFDLVD